MRKSCRAAGIEILLNTVFHPLVSREIPPVASAPLIPRFSRGDDEHDRAGPLNRAPDPR